jgi:hypothetical protein
LVCMECMHVRKTRRIEAVLLSFDVTVCIQELQLRLSL